jgi:hypothetical protein
MRITVRQLKQLIKEEVKRAKKVSLYEQAQDAKVDQLASFFEENPEIGEAVANLNPQKLQKLLKVSKAVAEKLPPGGMTEAVGGPYPSIAGSEASKREMSDRTGRHQKDIFGDRKDDSMVANIGILAGLLGLVGGTVLGASMTHGAIAAVPELAAFAALTAGLGTSSLIDALRRAGFAKADKALPVD